jgi:hypothetical protein
MRRGQYENKRYKGSIVGPTPKWFGVRTLVCLTYLTFLTVVTSPGAAQGDSEQFYNERLTLLREEATNATGLTQCVSNLANLRSLYEEVSTRGDISEDFQISVLAVACSSSVAYLSAVRPSSIGPFAREGASNVLGILSSVLNVIKQPLPLAGSLNVMPPASETGFWAAGMSPRAIADPKQRAEYERRIAQNKAAAHRTQMRQLLERSAANIKLQLKLLVRASENLASLVRFSRLPESIKEEILSEAAPNVPK